MKKFVIFSLVISLHNKELLNPGNKLRHFTEAGCYSCMDLHSLSLHFELEWCKLLTLNIPNGHSGYKAGIGKAWHMIPNV